MLAATTVAVLAPDADIFQQVARVIAGTGTRWSAASMAVEPGALALLGACSVAIALVCRRRATR